MKYLRSIESFKKLKYQERTITTELQPIREEFENDVTWGGSLLGRLINSAIRVIGVRYKATKIDSLIESFRKTLDILLQEVSPISEKNEAKTIKSKMLLQEIYKLVMSEKTVEEKIETLLSVSDYKTRKSATGTPTPQNASYKFKNPYKKIFEYAEQAAEPEKAAEPDESEDGMIDVTIGEVKKCELENKDLLVEKLEKFKSLLMEIEYKKEAQEQTAQGQAAQGQSAQGQDKNKKYKLYSETRKFLEGYLDIIRQIESNSVKQKSPFKKGDMVMWKKTTDPNKGRLTFGTIVEDIKENDDKIKVKGLDKGNTFPLPIKHALALTFFDEEKYKKMEPVDSKNSKTGRKPTVKEILAKLIKARIAYYTFMNKKDSAKESFYEDEIERLEKILPKNTESEYDDLESQDEAQPAATSKPSLSGTGTSSKPAAPTAPTVSVSKPTAPTVSAGSKPTALPAAATSDKDKGGLVKASFDYYLEDEYLILEEADVRISTKDQIAAWGYIVDVYSDLKKKSDMKKHVEYISGLLEGGSEAKKTISKLGKKIFKLLTSDEYKPIGIDKIKSFTKETSKAVAKVESLKFINEANEAEATPENEENLKGSELICSLARVILSLDQDQTLAKSFVDDKGEGVSKSILKMISSFDGMKEAINKQQNTSEKSQFLRSYIDFRLILEADEDESSDFDAVGPDDDDEEEVEGEEEATETEGTEENKLDNVQIAWFDESNGGKGPFKKDEEKEWLVDIEQIKKPMGPEKEKINIDVADGKLGDPKLDLIIRIVNIFGKAYSLYATQYIPSGRPEGRVSQKTLREYEYIGKGDGEARGQKGSDFFVPGEGPWAAKRVFEKWEDGINEILEDKWYRRVLANVTYVSQAERETGVEQEGKKSGVTLMAFIIEMLTMKGTFKENKRNLLRKYFNIDAKDDNTGVETGGGQGIRKDDAEKPDSPVFTKVEMYNSSKGTNPEVTGRGKIKKGYFYKAKIKIGNVPKNYILWVAINDTKYILFRAQETAPDTKPVEESFITARFKESNFKYKIDKLVPPLKTVLNKSVLLVGIKIDNVNRFKKDGLIDLYTLTNSTNIKSTTFTGNSGCKIIDLEIMVVSEKTTNNEIQLKPVEIDWNTNFKATNDFPLSSEEVLNIKNQLKP